MKEAFTRGYTRVEFKLAFQPNKLLSQYGWVSLPEWTQLHFLFPFKDFNGACIHDLTKAASVAVIKNVYIIHAWYMAVNIWWWCDNSSQAANDKEGTSKSIPQVNYWFPLVISIADWENRRCLKWKIFPSDLTAEERRANEKRESLRQ